MAIIVDPDNLVYGTDLLIDTSAKTIRLVTGTNITNEGSTGGVSLQAFYSKLKELWKTDSTLIKYPFPMELITSEQGEFVNGWKPYDDATRKLIRNGGWAEKNSSGTVLRKYMGVVSLGSIGSGDQPYYNWNGGSKTNFTYAGPINEAIQIYGDASNGNFDYSDGGDSLTLFVREQGKTYASATNASIGASTLTYQVYRFPLSNTTDLNITVSDATIESDSTYMAISVQYYTTDQMRNIDGTSAPFRIIVTDAMGGATAQQIYEKIQYLLRQNSDIDSGAGTVIGATTDALLSFRGTTLVGVNSVAIDGLNSNFLNYVEFYDKNGVKRVYPFVAAGSITFGPNAGVGDFKYWMYPASTFGTSGAAVVTDKDGNPISGTYIGGGFVNFTFNYDTDTQGGHTAGTDFPVKVVGIGLGGGQYTTVDYTLIRSAGQSISLAPAQERNYSNP